MGEKACKSVILDGIVVESTPGNPASWISVNDTHAVAKFVGFSFTSLSQADRIGSGRKKARLVVPVKVVTGAHNSSPKGMKRGCESVRNSIVEGSFT
jgi:hypothetical protein